MVVDDLQLWAKVAEDLRGNFSVRERVEMLGGLLRELALGLYSPVLALASQNRSAGNYGTGKGSAALDSLKESGDLEYAANVVLFLTEAQERCATPPARAVELTVAKNRHGDMGKVGLIFRPDLAPCGKSIRRPPRGERGLSNWETVEESLCRMSSQMSTYHGVHAWREGEPMDTLTEHEMEVIVQRLETFVTDLEHDGSLPMLYAFVLLAQEYAGMKKARYALAHIRRCLALAHRMRTIRDRLVFAGGRWTPLHDVGEVLHAEATRLSSLYGVARPACRTARRALQQAFRVSFTQATGKAYQKYGLSLTAKERATITAFWDNALRTALARFQATSAVEALDQVMACPHSPEFSGGRVQAHTDSLPK